MAAHPWSSDVPISPQEAHDAVKILYTNWRGETAVRSVVLPADSYARAPRFEANEWHPEPQWLLTLYDVEKRGRRTFALAGIKAWGAEAVKKALAAQPAAPRLPTGYTLVPIKSLDRLRSRSEQATPGPYYTVDPPWGTGGWIVAGNPDPHAGLFIADCDGMGVRNEEDEEARPNVGKSDDAALLAAAANFAREVLAAPHAVQDAAGDGWQPIKTAPRDGREILVYCADSEEQFVVVWDGNWIYAPVDMLSVSCGPDYWRPIPAPPRLSAEQGE